VAFTAVVNEETKNNFEKEDGIKDTALVLSFMRAVNQVMN
jgi:hypothetical protein